MDKYFELMKKLVLVLFFGLLAVFLIMPAEADATSGEATDVLNAVEAGNLDGMEIETIILDKDELEANFSVVAQDALNEARSKASENILTRIVIPDGEYQPEGRALEMYSNTILDLRGIGASTPTDTSDDYGNVIVYQSTKEDDPLALRCGHGDKYGEENSLGYDYYQNMTVLGGTIVGHQKGQNVSTSGNTCNVRFGHASNVRIIGTQITDNHGAHHLEIGAAKDVLVADCHFAHFTDGEGDEESSKGESLEAIQLDVSHQQKDNFAYFGRKDDLPVINATITDCHFEDVVRGVGTHHAVFGKPYDNIVVKNNTFTDIHDKAIHFLYTKNCTIANNTMNHVYSGILFQYMYPEQQYLPNKGTASQSLEFNAGDTQIYGNEIHLDDSMTNHTEGGADSNGLVKFGIRVGGEYLASKIKNRDQVHPEYINAGTYYLSGVQVNSNTIDVVNGGKKSIRAGIMIDYAKSCSVSGNSNTDGKGNIIDLKGCNQDGYAGIFVPDSFDVTVTNNVVSGITNGAKADGINLIRCKGDKTTMIQDNSVIDPKRYGIACNNTTNKNLSIYHNTIQNPGQAGITVYSSNIKNVTNNDIMMTNGSKMTNPGIRVSTNSTVNAVSNNTISGTASHGIQLVAKSTATYITKNIITSPGEDGVFVYDNSKSTSVSSNTITNPGRYGIMISKSSKATKVGSNKISGAKNHGIILSEKSYVTYVSSNKITKPGGHGILIHNNTTGKFTNYNTITEPKKSGITISNGSYAQEILKNTIKNAPLYGVLIGDKSSAYLIQENKLTNCKKRSFIINGKANAIVANAVKGSAYKNKPYLKKGMSFTKFSISTTKGKTLTVPYLKANTKGAITWSSSNKKVLSVSKAGKVKAVGKGTAYVKATRNGLTVKAKITVK